MFKGLKNIFLEIFKSEKKEVKTIEPVPFDDEIINKLKHTYINGLTASIYIKYLMSIYGTKRCEYMAYALDDVTIVLGEIKKRENPNTRTLQGWIEKDGFVYDTVTLMKYDLEAYNKIYDPKNVVKYTKDEFLEMEDNNKIYDVVRSTTLDDFKPNGKKRNELDMLISTAKSLAKNNKELSTELEEFLESVDYYDEELETLNVELKSYEERDLTSSEIRKLKACIKRYNEALTALRRRKLEHALNDTAITSCEDCPINKIRTKH